MTRWLFVSGAGRTGTKLLAWCLAQHPDVALCTHEANVAPKLMSLCEGPPAPIIWHCGEAVYEQTMHLWGYDEYWAQRWRPQEIARAALEGLRVLLAPGKLYIGDKSPAYTMLWPLLRELCPGCEIVYIERELEATMRSWLRVGFAADEDQARNEIIRRVRTSQGCPGARWLTLEELEAHPREVLGNLLVDLGLDPSALPWKQVERQILGDGRLD
jgi:hypothetical protein